MSYVNAYSCLSTPGHFNAGYNYTVPVVKAYNVTVAAINMHAIRIIDFDDAPDRLFYWAILDFSDAPVTS